MGLQKWSDLSGPWREGYAFGLWAVIGVCFELSSVCFELGVHCRCDGGQWAQGRKSFSLLT